MLTSYAGVVEQPPNDPDDWDDFSVVAAARLDNASGKFIAPGIFREAVTPGDAIIAYAQAETINGISGRLEKFDFPLLEQLVEAYPFRVWTTYGWQWQARLTRGDMLRTALESDQTLREWFAAIDIDASSTGGWENLDDLTLH